eukprot:GHVR01137963.1.p1 GENE.GHVR01137963.1~~GHVR01137963.1.p1  ORF type:complete len:466 (-),score=37.22 GHVR01137963.1:2194-3591(-)
MRRGRGRRGRGDLSVLTEEYIQSLEHTIPPSNVDSKMLALVDAGCSKTIFAEAHVKPYVFDTTGERTSCTLGDGRSTLECAYVASVHCRVEDLSGTPVDIILRGAVSPTVKISMISPADINTMWSETHAHVVIKDADDKLQDVRVNKPSTSEHRRLPWIRLELKKPEKLLMTQEEKYLFEQHLGQGHAGAEKLLNTLKEKGIRGKDSSTQSVRRALEFCPSCQPTNTLKHNPPNRSHAPVEFNGEVQQDVMHITRKELCSGGKTCTPQKYNTMRKMAYVSVMKDVATGWVSYYPMASKDEVAQHLTIWIAINGAPKIIRTDGAFAGGDYQKLTRKKNIFLSIGVPHTSTQQGTVERENRRLRALLRASIHYTGAPFDAWPAFAIALASIVNSTVDSSKGTTPWKSRFNNPPGEFFDTFQHCVPVVFSPTVSSTAPKTLEVDSGKSRNLPRTSYRARFRLGIGIQC